MSNIWLLIGSLVFGVVAVSIFVVAAFDRADSNGENLL